MQCLFTFYRQFLILTIFIFATHTIYSQKTRIPITGIVLEKNSRQAIEFATVTVLKNEDNAILSGVTTDVDGKFTVYLPSPDCYLEISFIGFKTKKIKDFSVQAGRVDLGEILVNEDSETLDEVVVSAEKSTTEFKLDKRVFNVGKDISSTGASALEVLNNVPSVNVNIEGEISLRGNTGVQILINGKPSVLASEQGNALGTITADMIEKVEVITNPSAKYEAEGTSGIINIVLKKEERKGLNGSISVNTGTPHNHSIGLSLNRRTEKFNLFSQLGVGYRELPRDNENINRNLSNQTTITSDGKEFRNEFFYNVILGTDYHIDKYNVLTLSGSFAYEVEDQPSEYAFLKTDGLGNTLAEWIRSEETEATNPKYQYELQYKKDFKDDKKHDLVFSALGNFFGKDQSSEFENDNLIGNEVIEQQQTRTEFKEARYTFKLDYTKPFTKEISLETGAQYFLNDVSNDFAVSDNINGVWVLNDGQTNIFEYNQKVLGIYSTGAYEGEKWGIKLGIRVENTDLGTFLVNTNARNDQNFTDLFPSAHTSYKINESFSIQAGYSRRIFRPRLWDLNPFFNIRNNFSIRTGNPDLLPEYTDSYEVSSIHIFQKASVNFSIFHQYTTAVVERIATFEDNVSTTLPFNIGTKRSTGLEINGKYTPVKWITFNGDFNYNYFNRLGDLEGMSFDFNADRWFTKVNTKLKLLADIDIEITGQYQSAYQTVQGRVSRNVFADMGIRKKVLKGKAILNFSIRDIFASRIRKSETKQADFFLYSRGLRGRFITFGVSYGFGKGEAMEYSGRRRR